MNLELDQLSANQIRTLATAHVHRFEYRLTGSGGRVNHDECQRHLAIWKAILVKVKRPEWRLLLSAEEKREIQAAVLSGDFEGLLRATAEPPS